MRFQIVEILKFVVAVSIGYTLREMLQHVNRKTISCPSTDSYSKSRTPTNNDWSQTLHEQLKMPYNPTSMDDILEYRVVSQDYVFDSRHCQVDHPDLMKPHETTHRHVDLAHIVRETMRFIDAKSGDRFVSPKLLNAFERIDPLRGKEYILDLELTDSAPKSGRTPPSRIFHMEMVKPFGSVQVASWKEIQPNSVRNPLYLLIPLHLNQTTQFASFIDNLEKEVFYKKLHLNVLVAVYGDHPESRKYVEDIYKKLTNRFSGVPVASIQLLNVSSAVPFSSHAIKNWLISKVLPKLTSGSKNAHLILADLNVDLTNEFYLRCQTILLSQADMVYFPIPYVKSPQGHWDRKSHQVACLTSSIYYDVGAFNTADKNKWSDDEENAFYERVFTHKLKIVRSADPGVRVSYTMPCVMSKNLKFSKLSRCAT